MIEPEYSLNIGYVARVAGNFGVKRMFVIANDLSFFNSRDAERFASHASSIVEEMKNLASFEELRNKFEILIGTTAITGKRKSNITRKTLDIKDCSERIAKLVRDKKEIEICLVLGRDTTGLTNEELRQCDFTTSIQTGSNYNTLNVSHAAAIVLFALDQAIRNENLGKHERTKGGSRVNNREERGKVISLFQELAQESDFQKFKQEKLRETLSRLLNRSDPSLRELCLMMGVASRAISTIKRLRKVNEMKKD